VIGESNTLEDLLAERHAAETTCIAGEWVGRCSSSHSSTRTRSVASGVSPTPGSRSIVASLTRQAITQARFGYLRKGVAGLLRDPIEAKREVSAHPVA
jgi:hypothetical protein